MKTAAKDEEEKRWKLCGRIKIKTESYSEERAGWMEVRENEVQIQADSLFHVCVLLLSC